jgi:hypothetical protein
MTTKLKTTENQLKTTQIGNMIIRIRPLHHPDPVQVVSDGVYDRAFVPPLSANREPGK